MLENLPPLRDVLSKYGLRAKKSLGQNFLLDLNLTLKIARAAGPLDNCDVIEIGPGPGGLTRAILASGARHLYALERDARCIQAGNDIADAVPGRLTLIEADAMEIDIASIGTAPRKIIANLPYNIASPLLISWLKQASHLDSMTLMFQREVANRLTASPSTKAYGRMSVMAQWLCDVQHEFDVPPEAFTPPPKVTSTIVSFYPRPEPLAPATWDDLEFVTAMAFGQRRKMLRASLKSLNIDLEAIDIKPTSRAEDLSVVEFCRLAEAYRLKKND